MYDSGAVVSAWSLLIRTQQRACAQAETPPIVLCRFPRPALGRSSVLDLRSESSLGTLGRSMTSYERRPDYVAIKPTWKGNVGWLLLIAMIACASIFVFIPK